MSKLVFTWKVRTINRIKFHDCYIENSIISTISDIDDIIFLWNVTFIKNDSFNKYDLKMNKIFYKIFESKDAIISFNIDEMKVNVEKFLKLKIFL